MRISDWSSDVCSSDLPDVSRFAIHQAPPIDPVVGRLVDRGLYDELKGSAYAVVDGIDGRTHNLRFDDIDMPGDAKPGPSVERRTWDVPRGQRTGRPPGGEGRGHRV